MENYIVHIYRCYEISPEEIAGIVENVAKNENIPFKNFDELVKLMARIPNTAELTFRVE